METFEEFKLKTTDKERHFKVKNSWGVYDYYKYYRKNKPKDKKFILTEKQYYAFFRRVNQLLAEDFISSNVLEFPYRLGKLELLQKKNRAYFVDGKLKISRSINWDATLRLWYEDKDCYNKKTLVYDDKQTSLLIHYSKENAVYNNKSFYEFKINRFLRNKALKNFNDQLLCFNDFEIKNLYNG